MKSRPLRISTAIRATALLLLAVLFGAGCAVLEPGQPVAAVTVKARSEYDVMDVVERVFTADGYRIYSQTTGTVVFEKKGNKMDRVMYGNWMGGDLAERARVVISSKGDGRYRVRVTPLIVHDPNDVAFEDAHRTAQVISFHYSGLLRQVKADFK
jgi:hypothetical protein